MRRFSTKLFAAVIGCAAMPFAAWADAQHCKLVPKGGLIADSYEIVGDEACKQACEETQGCTAWSYTPHNFNPKTGPGWCRMLGEVAGEIDDKRDYCGRL
ncbi:PAN domain-containing protein [Rhodobacteraceae bacterium D3-12]|nr:PAN domain-containing protein [Rhodobacteraceae bacterium D3-12]